MKQIEKDELYQHLSQFLHAKGISLQEGSYAQTIQKSCRILADVINLGQQGLGRAKAGIDQKLEQVREVIHRKTAPKPPRHASSKPTSGPDRAENPTSKKTTKASKAPSVKGSAKATRTPKGKKPARKSGRRRPS